MLAWRITRIGVKGFCLMPLIFVGVILPQVPSTDGARQKSVLIGNESFGLAGEMVFRISGVRPESAAARSGLRPNDLVFAVEGQKVTDIEQMRRTLLDPMVRPGTKFVVTVGRLKQGTSELETVKLVLGAIK